MTTIINVSNPHCGDTFVARGERKTASSTQFILCAVERCAQKIAGARPFTLRRVTDQTWLAEITDPSDP